MADHLDLNELERLMQAFAIATLGARDERNAESTRVASRDTALGHVDSLLFAIPALIAAARERDERLSRLDVEPERGREAEELRHGIEKLLDGEPEAVPVARLRRLLDEVDARDSLAFLVAARERDAVREAERLREVIRTGGAMLRLERATLGVPGGIDPEAERLRALCREMAYEVETIIDAHVCTGVDECGCKGLRDATVQRLREAGGEP